MSWEYRSSRLSDYRWCLCNREILVFNSSESRNKLTLSIFNDLGLSAAQER